MPQIPHFASDIIARPARGRIEASQIVPRAIAGVGQQIERFGELMAETQIARNKAENQLEASETLTKARARIEEGIQVFRSRPDPLTHRENVMQLMQEIGQDALQNVRNEDVRFRLQPQLNTLVGEVFREEGRYANQLLVDRSKAALHEQLETYGRQAAEAIHPADRDIAERRMTEEIEGRVRTGVLSAEQGAELKTKSRNNVLEKNMDFLRLTNRPELRRLDREGAFTEVDTIKRLKILEHAQQDEDAERARNERVFKEAQDVVERDWSSRANFGRLSDVDVDNALAGRDPYVTPDKARQFKTINDNPPTGEGSLQVRAIMEDYYSGSSSQSRIEATRELLNHLRQNLGRPNALISKALNELQSDERTGRTIRASELAAGIKFAEDEYRSRSGAILLGRVGRMKETQDLAEIRNRLRQSANPSEDAKKLVDEYLKRREKDAENLPQRNKDVLKLEGQ